MNMNMNKKGVSLIVLVITIIVMIVLAAAIILSLQSSGIIGKANQAKADTNDKQLLEAASFHLAEYDLAIKTGDASVGTDAEAYVKRKLGEADFSEADIARITVVAGEIVLASAGGSNANIYNGVRIPEGFVPSIYEGETDPATGLVIYQTTLLEGIDHETAMATYNQYVWVPEEYVGEGKFQTPEPEDVGYVEEYGEYDPSSADEKAEYDAIRQSIEDNGGFYIAKYDAGLPEGVTKDTANYGQNAGDLTIPVSVKDATPWNYIPWDSTVTYDDDTGTSSAGNWANPGCAKVARATLNAGDVKSHLIYGFQIRAVFNFEEKINKEIVVFNLITANFDGDLGTGPIGNWSMDYWALDPSYTRNSYTRTDEIVYSPEWSDEYPGFRVALYLK